MIEELKNCPNCGGTLNEAGRCSFCGSKVYDFLTINFDKQKYPSALTYVRMRVKDSNGKYKIIIAPIIVDTVAMTSRPEYCSCGYPDSIATRMRVETTLDIHCQVVDSAYLIENEEEE
jgi:hypothetical protein